MKKLILFFACLFVGHTAFGMDLFAMINTQDPLGFTPIFLIFDEVVNRTPEELSNLSEVQKDTLKFYKDTLKFHKATAEKKSDAETILITKICLEELGARLDIKDNFGYTILDYAEKYKEKYPQISKLILEWQQKIVEILEPESSN